MIEVLSQSRMSRCTADQGLPSRQVMSHVHSGQPCQPCILCKKGNQSKYFHPKSWKDASLLERLQQFEPSLHIQPHSCICRPCRNEVNDIKEGFVPRWRKSSKGVTQPCFAPECTHSAQKVTKLANRSTLSDFFSIQNENIPSQSSQVTDEGVPLCTEHYGEWYRHSNPTHKRCKTCGKNLTDLSKSRPYPQPKLIQKFLVENTDFSGEINSDDRACFTCYKSHLVTVQHLNSIIHSTNPDLETLLDEIKGDLPAISDFESVVSYTCRITAIHVGEALLKHTALLLPEVYELFNRTLKENTYPRDITVDPEMADTLTTTWLRSQLSSILQPHMAYRCSVKKCGTVLYRYGGDLVHALNVALGEVRKLKIESTADPHSTDQKFQCNLSDTCLSLNTKLHACIKKLMEQDASSPHRIEDIDIDTFIQDLDPDIWKAICLLTQPISTKATTSSNHVRKIRRCFCVCMLLFSINSQCSFPMHTLIADAIETCGGSSRLQKLLNRLGVCVSIDTHERYIQYRVEKRMKEGPMADYPQNSFMIVSADNLDFVHSFARVYSGKQQSSWHGTTMQVVQPQPLGLTDTVTQPSAAHPKHPSKRLHSELTPCSSPGKPSSSHSPVPKKQRRMRTGTENSTTAVTSQPEAMPITSHIADLRKPNLKLSDFQLSTADKQSAKEISEVFDQYMLLKLASESGGKMIDLQSYLTVAHNIEAPECSNVIYYKVLHQRCDDKETLLNVINDVYTEFISTGRKEHIFIEGDQATYERLQSIKREYVQDLSWMTPFNGDWHILKNFQEVLLKIYFDAGLRDLCCASGYLPNSVGTNFKRTHNFLLEVWEALFRYLLSIFLSKKEAPSDFLESTRNWILSLPLSVPPASAQRNLNAMFADLSEKYSYQDKFSEFMSTNMEKDETFKFWGQFVLKDCFAYVSLYLAIRTGNWKLRVAAMKSMAPLFTAYDRQKYQKLLPQHIVDMLTIPTDTLSKLESGGFTVSLKGRPCHSVGVDEAHEMCINKNCKEFITRPSADYINRTALFIPIRAEAMKNFEAEIFPEKRSKPETSFNIFSTNIPNAKKFEENVQNQITKLKTSSLTDQQNGSGLHHIFNTKSLTAEQAHDLLNFREIGQADYEAGVEYYTIRTPSVKPPKHRKRLLTFTERHSRRKKVSAVEKERKLQIQCWKKRVAFSTSTGVHMQGYEQYIALPRAIATSEGTPTKGSKSNTTNSLEKRYQHSTPSVILTSLPSGWIPDAVLMEGMFLINIKPWIAHKNLGEYANFLLKQHVYPYFRGGSSCSSEVHIIFDDPERQGQSPKFFERKHRNEKNPVPDDHNCTEFISDMVIPLKWRENVLNCRKCKRNLVCFLSNYFLERVKTVLQPNQRFVTAGGFNGDLRDQARFVLMNTSPQSDPALLCNAEEGDTRIWLHTVNSGGKKKLVLSPDTDVYHIGLPIVAETDHDVLVRLSKFNSVEHRILDTQALISALGNDPELAHIPSSFLPSVMQVLFVCTGCDFISFFNGLGKASFLATLFEYCKFICANNEQLPGTLGDANSDGKLSFFRLVGCAYFRKHRAAFLPAYPSPATLYNSLKDDCQSPLEHHIAWLDMMRERIWSRIKYEEEMIPSDGALARHWQRSSWVLSIWKQATSHHMIYPPLNGNGWKQPDHATLEIDWDSDDHLSLVRTRVALLQKGCGCKTGCLTGRCKCKKSKVFCGPGCKCEGCLNLPTASNGASQSSLSDSPPTTSVMDILPENIDSEDSEDDSGDDSSGNGDDLEMEVNQMMTDIFGDSGSEESDTNLSMDC